MPNKRLIEVIVGGCPVCDQVVRVVRRLAGDAWEVKVLPLQRPAAFARATELGVTEAPAVVIDGRLADGCQGVFRQRASQLEDSIDRLHDRVRSEPGGSTHCTMAKCCSPVRCGLSPTRPPSTSVLLAAVGRFLRDQPDDDARTPGQLRGWAAAEPTRAELATAGMDHVVLLIRDPNWLYVYWDITDWGWAKLCQHGITDPANGWRRVLRVRDLPLRLHGVPVDGGREIELCDLAREWYLPAPPGHRSVSADLGYRSPDGEFLVVARSRAVDVRRIHNEFTERALRDAGLGGSSGEGSGRTATAHSALHHATGAVASG